MPRTLFDFFKFTFSAPDSFRPDSVEEQFLHDYARRFVAHRRAISLLAVVYWSAFAAWDIAQSVENDQFKRVLPYVLAFRILGTVCLSVCAWLSFQKSFADERYATNVLIATVTIPYALLGLMLLLVPFPVNYMYYSPGLFMVMIFAYGMFRLRSKPAIWLTFAFLLFSTFVYAFMSNDAVDQARRVFSPYYFLFSSLYLASFAIIGCAIVVELERTAREAYARERQLATSNWSVNARNVELKRLNTVLEESKRDMEAKTTALVAIKEEAREAAVRSNENKSQFLASAAHDLRQPMQAVSNLFEATQHAFGRGNHETGVKLLAEAQAALGTALSSFNAIMDISQLESGFIKAEYATFPIDELLTDVLTPLRVLASKRGVELRLRLSVRKTMVRSDRALLSRVLANLVGNAIKYCDPAKPRPCVLVGVVNLPNRVRIDIVDNGVGIASHHWANVFEPFFQLRHGPRDRQKGLGLGLSIVKAIMELLSQHRYEMRSTEGKGTRFSLDVPYSEDLCTFSKAQVQKDSAVFSEVEGRFVIYIEDDPLVRASTEALFEEFGVLYESAGSMQELKQKLCRLERLPDMVITGQHLHGGWTAKTIMDLISTHIGASAPVIVMTADATMGAPDCPGARLLAKPAPPEALLAAIAAQLAAAI